MRAAVVPIAEAPATHTELKARVFNIQRYCIHDGPGIRATVFLKGCPLACWWCANPESQGRDAELGFIPSRCEGCGKCVEVCAPGALVLKEDRIPILNREDCDACGACVPVCFPEALALYGKEMSVGEVFAEVRKDAAYYRTSGGGVTLSGGEPLLYPLFIQALFKLCRESQVGTAIETAGYCNPRHLREVLPLTDTLLFDLKHMDSAQHERVTGMPNALILSNARLAAASGTDVRFRMPLIPGINDSQDNIEATACFLRELGEVTNSIELLPYHRMGVGKYEAIGLPYRLQGVEPLEPQQVEAARAMFEAFGTRCSVSR